MGGQAIVRLMNAMQSTESSGAAFSYVGEELDLFSFAVRWKRYWISQIAPYVGSCVLEVGAGTGTNTVLLASSKQRRWVCLEPDPALASQLEGNIGLADTLVSRPEMLEVLTGDMQSLPTGSLFDTILYIDVLEHIEHDRQEVSGAYQLLAPGGHLIVLSPAHQFLYSPFDRGIGHFRRYSRRTLREACKGAGSPIRLFYLDSCGFAASLMNRMLLKQKLPNLSQIQFWDTYLVAASLVVDPLLGFNFGKTVVGVWRKPD